MPRVSVSPPASTVGGALVECARKPAPAALDEAPQDGLRAAPRVANRDEASMRRKLVGDEPDAVAHPHAWSHSVLGDAHDDRLAPEHCPPGSAPRRRGVHTMGCGVPWASRKANLDMMWDRRRSSHRRHSLQCPFIRCSSREWCVDVYRGPRGWSSSHLWRRDRNLLTPSDSELRDRPELLFSPPPIREQLAQPCPRRILNDCRPAPGGKRPRPECVREGGVRVQGGVNIRVPKREKNHAHTVPDETTERGAQAYKRSPNR